MSFISYVSMRNLGLDLLRFAAVVLVLGRHLHLPLEVSPALTVWKRGGWIGVDLFFVLSGFLVSSLLFKEHIRSGTIDIGRFLVRRGFKIYPAFWCMLTFTLVICNLQGTPPERQALVGELLFLQNYVGGIWPHTWSLAVEEHFYLGLAALFAVVLAYRKTKNFDWIPYAFSVIAITCLTLRVLNLVIYPVYSHHAYLTGTHIRIDSLFFGVMLSYLYHYRDLENRISAIPAWFLVASGCCLLAPAFIFTLEQNKWLSVVGFIPFYVGSGAMLLAALRLPTSTNATLNFLAGLGAASYSVYLWHLPVGEWGFTFLARVAGLDSFGFYLVNYLIGSFVVGWLFSHAIEYPTLRLRNFLFPSRTLSAEDGTKLSRDSVGPVPSSVPAGVRF